eukprot:CAMPEP_0194272768 /NCGR_PEP_ID=MMETSP0169-20130528/6243_1 /TAXON_ID=218684 /ORGANISM="Corethron pennatum, Strain L29A3" /LENGTH=350 /DNA_ID=CAMNT_0039015511 /DNA_START=532 /DNA_END=1581 /DNA_ORIENTATION=+
MYVSCLRDLCRQIGIPADLLQEELVFFPGDTPLATAARSLQAIEKVKEEMSRLMNGLKVFIVLDDVWCHEDVELFNFGEVMETSFALFVTTRTLDMFPSAQACWIDIPLLKPEDAVSYFFFESGRGDPLPSVQEFHFATKLVRKCGFLPLAIRIMAKMARAHPDFLRSENDLESITSTIKTVKDVSAANETIIHIVNRSFSFVTDADASFAVKICFAAMAVVFHRDDRVRPWISKNIVEVLWSKLLTLDKLRPHLHKLREYRLVHMADISRLLNIIGLVDNRQALKNKNEESKDQNQSIQLQIHHDLLWEYGKEVAVQYANAMKSPSTSNQTQEDSVCKMSNFEEMLVEW